MFAAKGSSITVSSISEVKQLLHWVWGVRPLFSKVATLRSMVVVRDWRYGEFFSIYCVRVCFSV